MRKLYTFIILFCCLFNYENLNAGDWLVVPGIRVGQIKSNTSEKELEYIYGKTNTKKSDIDVGEGFKEPGTILFPDDPTKILYIVWREPESRTYPRDIYIREIKTKWKTDKGVTIGTSLTAIEEINKKPFVLAGFGWDYSGTIIHSNGGMFKELGMNQESGIIGRTLILRLHPDYKLAESLEYSLVMGDRAFLSDHPAMKKLNPIVYEMIISFEPK